MLVLLSPAKTLDNETPSRTKKVSMPQFLDESEQLVGVLRKYNSKKLSSLMSISDKLAELNVDRFKTWQADYDIDSARPSIQAFRGDVYIGLDADTMSMGDIQFAQKQLRILSGLYGVLKPLDLMLPYRLEMGTSLKTTRGRNLYEFWGDQITQSLNAELAKHSDQSIVNLASNEYFKSVNKKVLQGNLISPVFKDEKNGDYKVISFFAKKARGAMARYLIDERCATADAVKAFNSIGYRYSKKASTDEQPVFLRTEKVAMKYSPTATRVVA